MADDSKKVSFETFLEGIFEECNRCRIEKNLVSWYDLLIVATLNLSTEMSIDKLKSFVELKKSLINRIAEVDRQNNDLEIFVVPADVEDLLFDWEVELRKIRRDSGLQHNVKIERGRFT